MSDVVELIVCDQEGVFTGVQKGKIAPDSGDDENIYTFYAVKDGSTKKDIKKVQLTMPIGGKLNGIIRLPKIGERILVIVQGNSYYLMSYLPDKADMEFRQVIKETDKDGKEKSHKDKSFVEDKAFSIRYESPNPLHVESKTKGENLFSELKFSTEKTFWRREIDVTKKDGKWKDSNENIYGDDRVVDQSNEKGTVFNLDEVDRVRLLSTGDLYTSAGNFNGMMGRRIALFSGDENIFTAQDYDNYKQGDITGKAGHKIYLEAQDGIVLKCGRSEIRIDDAGITIVSAKIDPQYGIADDSKIFLDPRTGVTIGGANININANTRYTISERCGGNISSIAGMTRICGRDVQVASQNLIDAGITFASSMYDYGTIGDTINDAYEYKNDKTKKASDLQEKVEKLGIGGEYFSSALEVLSSATQFGVDKVFDKRIDKLINENVKTSVIRKLPRGFPTDMLDKASRERILAELEADHTDLNNVMYPNVDRSIKQLQDEYPYVFKDDYSIKGSLDAHRLTDQEVKETVEDAWFRMHGTTRRGADEVQRQLAEEYADSYVAEKKAGTEATRSDDKKKFTGGSQAVSVAIADLALSIADTLIKTSDLVFASIEKDHENIVADKGIKGRVKETWTGADLRDRCNKAYYWATQTIIEALNGACFGLDIAIGAVDGARLQTGIETSSIRFHGGYGDMTCSSVEEKGVQFIRGISPVAASRMANIGMACNFVGSGLDLTKLGVQFATEGNDFEEELKYL